MAYVPNIPQPNDLLSESQGDILDNFQSANTTYGINHYPFDNATVGQIGKHKYVGMPVLGAAPATTSTEGALYFKTVGPGSALFMVRDNNAGTEVQLTTASVGNVSSATNGYCWLPGGLFLQWGTTTPASNSTIQSVSFNVPFSSTPYNIQVTGYRAASSPGTTDSWVSTANLSANGFDIFNSGGHSFQFMWTAIGPKP
jgi:hypothetical protein